MYRMAIVALLSIIVGSATYVSVALAFDTPDVQPFVDRLARDASVTNLVLLLIIAQYAVRDYRTNNRIFKIMANYGQAQSDTSAAIEIYNERLLNLAAALNRRIEHTHGGDDGANR